jgi:hypothetical protein
MGRSTGTRDSCKPLPGPTRAQKTKTARNNRRANTRVLQRSKCRRKASEPCLPPDRFFSYAKFAWFPPHTVLRRSPARRKAGPYPELPRVLASRQDPGREEQLTGNCLTMHPDRVGSALWLPPRLAEAILRSLRGGREAPFLVCKTFNFIGVFKGMGPKLRGLKHL